MRADQLRRLLADIWRSLMTHQADISAPVATLMEDEWVAHRRVELAKAIAPVAGIVEQLRIYTIGGVIKIVEELLRDVVPSEVSDIAADSMELKVGVWG